MNDFFSTLYEGFHPLDFFYIQNFSQDLYNSGVYVTIGILMLLSTLLLEFVYYYFISNYSVFYKRMYWFLWLLVISVLNYFIAYHLSSKALEVDQIEYDFMPYLTFSMVNSMWAMVFGFIFSLLLKIKSIKGSRTPF